MKKITYGIFAEDSAIQIFIQNSIPQLVSHFGFKEAVNFYHEESYTAEVVAKDGGYVFKFLVNYVAKGIKEKSLDLCFVGLDGDDHDHLTRFQDMEAQLIDSGMEDKALILIPIQAIEYWLWYIKVKKEDQSLANTAIIDRTNSRQELKKWVYFRKAPRTKRSNPIVENLTQSIDFPWLTAHSTSFQHFYDSFKAYLENNFGTAE